MKSNATPLTAVKSHQVSLWWMVYTFDNPLHHLMDPDNKKCDCACFRKQLETYPGSTLRSGQLKIQTYFLV